MCNTMSAGCPVVLGSMPYSSAPWQVFLTVFASIWVYLLLALAGAQTYKCPTTLDPQRECSTITGKMQGLKSRKTLRMKDCRIRAQLHGKRNCCLWHYRA